MSHLTNFTLDPAPETLKAISANGVTTKLVVLAALCLLSVAAPADGQVVRRGEQVRRPAPPTSRLEIPPGAVASCGYTPSLGYELNQQANRPRRTAAPPPGRERRPAPAIPKVFTPQGSVSQPPPVTCGKFRLYYEDFQQGSAGFNDPSLGAARRGTLCAVLNYAESTLHINVNGTTDFIDLYIAHSWSPANPAPPSVTYLATAGPYFNPASGYGVTPGYYAGNVMLHATLGADPQPGQYDGVILVNFDQFYYNGLPYPISYWDDYQNTASSNCEFDLYSVLLHEVTHTLGFISSVQEDANFNAVSGVPNNGFTKFDQMFLYYGNGCASGSLQKVVTGASPSINPAVSGQANELRSNMIWLRNGPVAQNHPIYSGTLDPFYQLMVGSLGSHLAGTILAFTAMSQYAPGFQPNYVMGPSIGQSQRKREWTLAELRIFLTLGYSLNPAFGASASLNGVDQNAWLLLNNSPAYRTNCAQPMLAYGTPINFMETLPADFTALVNNNTPSNTTATQLTFNVSSLGVADAQGDTISVMPNTLFGVRGVSGNANDHARLLVNPAGTQIRYTPEPGFHGRAQFGFYLWDGHERGALRVVTVDVAPGGYVVPAGGELVVNPGLEDGTEMRQRILSPGVEHSAVLDFAYEGVFAGQNLSGAHPFNFITNGWNIAGGDVMENQWYSCGWGMGPDPQHGRYANATADWNAGMIGGFQHPIPATTAAPNQRYHHFHGAYNYSTLINPVQGCNVYRFEADLNFQKTGWAVGQNFTFQLQFVNNPSPNLHTQMYYTAPVNVTISTVAPNTWQHVTFTFQYCGAPTYFMNLLVQGLQNNPPPVLTGTGSTSPMTPDLSGAVVYAPFYTPFIDNISLKQVAPPPPLTLVTTASPATISCPPGQATLTGQAGGYVPCNATYTWQPGNLAGNAVTVSPSATTTYTLNLASASCPQSATSAATVNVLGNNVATGWPKHPAGQMREFFNAVGQLPGGDIVAAGFFSLDETFPPFPTFNAGNTSGARQLIVYRFSQSCGTAWAVALGSPSSDESVNDLVVDAAGDIFITGTTGTNPAFNSVAQPGLNAYVLKLNGNNGALMAAYSSSASTGAEGRALALDGAGNVYVTGRYTGALTFGSLPALNSLGSADVFIVRLDNALTTPLWVRSFGSTGYDQPGGIGLSSSGALYVAADIGGGMNIGSNTFTNAGAGTADVFIGRFNNATGAYVNGGGRMEGNAASNCSVRDMVVDAAGTVYFTGFFSNSFTTLTSANQDAYIASWQGATLSNNWVRQIGGPGFDSGSALALDGAGNLYAAGEYRATASFPGFTPSTLTTSGPLSTNVYVVKMSVGGAPAYATGSNSAAGSATYALGLTALPSGTAFVGGYFMGTTAFGTASMTATQTDCFLSRISPAGLFY